MLDKKKLIKKSEAEDESDAKQLVTLIRTSNQSDFESCLKECSLEALRMVAKAVIAVGFKPFNQESSDRLIAMVGGRIKEFNNENGNVSVSSVRASTFHHPVTSPVKLPEKPLLVGKTLSRN